jgi:hypothetical protein
MNRIEELQGTEYKNLVIENCSHPIEAMFFTNHIAYQRKLTSEERENIGQMGFTIIEF